MASSRGARNPYKFFRFLMPNGPEISRNKPLMVGWKTNTLSLLEKEKDAFTLDFVWLQKSLNRNGSDKKNYGCLV